ncbi:MAG: efflux RND transporter permease subunit [Acidobacteria bacterium]|nr:efflux RND transporter permease subunit [Acidobacteriota bacterium]
MKFSDLPIDRPVGVLMLLVCLTVLGGVAIVELPLDFMPEVEPPEVRVTVDFPGSHPLENLREVVKPIEEEIATIAGVKKIRSQAQSNRAWVNAEFDWSTNLDLKKMEIREAVERVKPELPDGIGQIRVEGFRGHGDSTAVLIGRISAKRDLSESWELLDRHIRRPLERIKGVARVDLGGVEAKQVRIDLDPVAIRKHGIHPGEVIALLQAANLDLDLGAVHGDLLRYNVRSVGRFQNLEEIRNQRLNDSDLRIRDIAEVSFREPDLPYGRHLDREFAISVEAFKEPTANTVDTTDRLMARIDEIRKDPDLRGINLLIWNNAGQEIRRSLAGLRNAGIFGGLLAIGILYFFLRRFSTTLIVAAAIPFSLIVTCGAMFLLGYTLNVLTMLGLMLGVGMLVDNAVVVMENIHRRQGQGMEPREAARIGTREVTLAVLASTATTIIVWSWLFVSEPSRMTIYMTEVAVTICLAVACSLLISLTFIPLAAARFVRRRETKPGFVMNRLVPGYRLVLAWTLQHRFVTLLGLALLAATAAIPFYLREKQARPKMREPAVAVTYQALGPVTKEIMEGYVDQVESVLAAKKEDLGYESMYSWYGQWGGGVTQMYVPWEDVNEDFLKALRKKVRPLLPTIPGVKLEVGERMWGGRRQRGKRFVSVALHGEDPEYLREIALKFEQRLQGIEEAKEVYGPTIRGQEEAQIVVDPDKARGLGVTPRMVADTIAFSFRGRNLRRFPGPGNELEMILGLPDDLQPGLGTLSDLRIPRENDTIPLGSVAEVVLARTDKEINREGRQTTSWVSVEFPESINTEQGKKLVAARLQGMQLPEGYSWDWGQWGRDRDEGLGTMARGLALSLVVVILLMMALFESFSQPFAILITLPLAFFGGFWILWLLGYELDTVAFVGLIILVGIVVNNGIVMVDHVNNLRREGKNRIEALLEGCGDRLRPVLMTAITTLFGLLPLAFSNFTVANAYIDSLAVVLIGGLATSTFFTLLALPVWYTAVEDIAAMTWRALPQWTGRKSPAGSVPALTERIAKLQ